MGSHHPKAERYLIHLADSSHWVEGYPLPGAPHLAVHQDPAGNWHITHLPSGTLLSPTPMHKRPEHIAAELGVA
jgi:hypothetical protein